MRRPSTASFDSVQKDNLAEAHAVAVATVMKVHPSWSHEDLLAAVDRRNNADPAEERTKATAVEKTKGATKSMLEKAKPVAVAAAAKAKEVTISEQNMCVQC